MTDIAIEQSKKSIPKTFEQSIPEHYRMYKDVFEEAVFNELPEHKPYDHAIELIDHKPYCGKLYNMTLKEQEALDLFLEENLRSGRIRPSKSEWGAPFFFVKKKDGKLRLVQDYRKLNAQTKRDHHSLPRIEEQLNKLRNANWYSKLDIRWGYNNVQIKDEDVEKAAFITNRGQFEPLVMFFGLTNAPATFQFMMDDLFRDLINRGKVIVYLDDILIFSSTIEEHRTLVPLVLNILQKAKLTCKPEKCQFETQEIEYLGYIITPGRIKMDPAKIAGVVEWPTLTQKKHMQAFLGFANFYRKFIKDFSRIALPLNRLTGHTDWKWTESEQASFDAIKRAITTAPILAFPKDNGKYRVECDASLFALRATLSQLQDGQW